MALVVATPPSSSLSKLPASPQEEDSMMMNLFVKFIDGKTFCLWLEPTTTMYHIKQRLIQQNNHYLYVHPEHVCVLSNTGKPLEDDATCDMLQDNTTIHMHCRQHGGCFMVSCSILGIILLSLLGSTCTCGLSLFVVPLLLPLLFVLPLFCL